MKFIITGESFSVINVWLGCKPSEVSESEERENSHSLYKFKTNIEYFLPTFFIASAISSRSIPALFFPVLEIHFNGVIRKINLFGYFSFKLPTILLSPP